MTVSDIADSHEQEGRDDAACWREVTRLRREHPAWVIIWLAPAGEYRAYRRLPRTRRDTALTAATPDGLAAAIVQTGQATHSPAKHKADRE